MPLSFSESAPKFEKQRSKNGPKTVRMPKDAAILLGCLRAPQPCLDAEFGCRPHPVVPSCRSRSAPRTRARAEWRARVRTHGSRRARGMEASTLTVRALRRALCRPECRDDETHATSTHLRETVSPPPSAKENPELAETMEVGDVCVVIAYLPPGWTRDYKSAP